MTIRIPRDDEPGPFETGMIKCDHVVDLLYNDTFYGKRRVWVPATCPLCHGTGWRLVPVVREASNPTKPLMPNLLAMATLAAFAEETPK
ncbi:MAG: hypothetical protein IMZ62_12725 [Chloroflexi bacterium]|nr:hypothetical protein [Chloroflexota bacterium]MBE3117517.1 hypothetical protein [Candidatus Atribacteria bacterium]